ncbi:MAG: cupredoxin domain-containing protein [Gemmatimonadota bacterium]
MSGKRAKSQRKRSRSAPDARPRGRSSSGNKRTASNRVRRLRNTRGATFWIIAIAVLALAGYLIKPAMFGRGGPPPTAEIIDVAASMSGFDKKLIRVRAGEPVTIRLTSLDNRFHNDGGGKHQFAIDGLDVSIIAPPLGSATATFTPEEPGQYEFYCDVCCGGRANPNMNGTLIVMS